MPRTARQVIPHLPHHIVQRGNRNQDIFFTPEDYHLYLSLLKEKIIDEGHHLLAYCLMKNHIHLIVQPSHENGLKNVGYVNGLYSRLINKKMGWEGYFWQGRFSSYPMGEKHLYHAMRYIELNPVFAGICKNPTDFKWSSARQRVNGYDSRYDLKVTLPSTNIVSNWKEYWQEGIMRHDMIRLIEQHIKSQEPLGICGTENQNLLAQAS